MILKMAARLGLDLKELFEFIVFRQIEAWTPVGEPWCYRVWEVGAREISEGLGNCIHGANTIQTIAASIVEELQNLKAPATATVSELLPRFEAWCKLIMKIAGNMDLSTQDAQAHWEKYVVPALLERIPAPVQGKGEFVRAWIQAAGNRSDS